MKLKLRGQDFDWINDFLSDKDVEVYVGKDCEGNEVFTGDIVTDTQNGGDYKVAMTLDLNFLPFDSCIGNFKLKSN